MNIESENNPFVACENADILLCSFSNSIIHSYLIIVSQIIPKLSAIYFILHQTFMDLGFIAYNDS